MPTWDTSPLTLPPYVHALRRWLRARNTRYRRLVESYTVIDKGTVYAMSANHIDLLLNGLVPVGTFIAPTVVDPATVTAHTSTSPGPAATSLRHKPMPEKVLDTDSDMFLDILLTIPDQDTKDELTADHGSLGTAVLIWLESQLSTPAVVDADFGTSALNRVAAHEQAGIASPHVSSFNSYKSELSRLLEVLPKDLRVAAPLKAQKLAAAARRLGPEILNGR